MSASPTPHSRRKAALRRCGLNNSASTPPPHHFDVGEPVPRQARRPLAWWEPWSARPGCGTSAGTPTPPDGAGRAGSARCRGESWCGSRWSTELQACAQPAAQRTRADLPWRRARHPGARAPTAVPACRGPQGPYVDPVHRNAHPGGEHLAERRLGWPRRGRAGGVEPAAPHDRARPSGATARCAVWATPLISGG